MVERVGDRIQERARTALHVVRRSRDRAAPARVQGLRHRRPGDVPACARLLRVVYSEGQFPVRFPDAPRGWLTDQEVLDAWVVERQGEVLGHVAVSRIGTDWSSRLRWREITGREPAELAAVTRYFVRARVRRQGIGTALLETALDDIRDRGLIPVLTMASTCTDAVRLVEQQGWRLLASDVRNDGLRLRYYAGPPEPRGG